MTKGSLRNASLPFFLAFGVLFALNISMNNSKSTAIEVTPENLPTVLNAVEEELDEMLLLLMYIEKSGKFDKTEGFTQMRRKLVETKGWLAWVKGEHSSEEDERFAYDNNGNESGTIN